jgi:hypothetical protein
MDDDDGGRFVHRKGCQPESVGVVCKLSWNLDKMCGMVMELLQRQRGRSAQAERKPTKGSSNRPP